MELKLSVDPTNAEEIKTAIGILEGLGGTAAPAKKAAPAKEAAPAETKGDTEMSEDAKKAAAKARRNERDRARRAAKKKEEEAAAAAADDAGGEGDDEITIESLAALARKKIKNADNKAPLKEKLAELGAKRVTDVDELDFDEMHEFLTDLDD